MKVNPILAREAFYTTCLLIAVLALRMLAANSDWVEDYYSNGFYLFLGKGFRFLYGWLPISLGDILYSIAVIWLVYKVYRLFKILRSRTFDRNSFLQGIFRYLRLFIWIYLVFNVFWGLNYNRFGIARQLGLEVKSGSVNQLKSLTAILLKNTNDYSSPVEWKKNASSTEIFSGAQAAYAGLQKQYPFLLYSPGSVKVSIFGVMGNYMGYTGYFNPFTGEAQVNNTVPPAVLPFVTCHEIAHQLGYAKENEANFVGFLSASQSADTSFRYSAYFEMFLYANSELFLRDSAAARQNIQMLSAPAKADLAALRAFRKKYTSPVDRLVSVIYDRYLKLNQQPAGSESYSRVVLWLMAYYQQKGLLQP
jgi:hypothetical protein